MYSFPFLWRERAWTCDEWFKYQVPSKFGSRWVGWGGGSWGFGNLGLSSQGQKDKTKWELTPEFEAESIVNCLQVAEQRTFVRNLFPFISWIQMKGTYLELLLTRQESRLSPAAVFGFWSQWASWHLSTYTATEFKFDLWQTQLGDPNQKSFVVIWIL